MEIEIRKQEAGDTPALEKMFEQLLLYNRAADPNSVRVAQIHSTAFETASDYARAERSYQRKFVATSGDQIVGFVGYHLPHNGNRNYDRLPYDVILVRLDMNNNEQTEILKRLNSVYQENMQRDWGEFY